MKRHLLIFALLPLMIACSKPQSAFMKVLEGDPIKPVMMGADSVCITLADYIPTLIGEPFDMIYFDGDEFGTGLTEIKFYLPDVLNPADGHYIHNLAFLKEGQAIAVPAITTAIPHKQAMYLQDADKKHIAVGFTQLPQNVSFAMYWQNRYIDLGEITEDPVTGAFVLPFPAECYKKGRSFVRIYAVDDNYLYNDLLLPLEDMQPVCNTEQLNRHDDQAQVLYSLMVDRFSNGDLQNDWHINDPEVMPIADYQGGDLKGITQKIEDGFFEELGITTLWISPVTQNPYSAWGYYAFNFLPEQNEDERPLFNNKYDKTRDHSRFSAYHGYWPIYTTTLDSRFGTDKDFRQLLAAAHRHNMNVVLDYVANHLHIESPVLQEHPDWKTDSILPDGRRNFELWDDARLTTWFDAHIPTLDLEREDVYQPMTDSAAYWIEHFDLDGFRHDACKHIPECYWRTLTQKLKTRFPDRHLWMIGETYGSPELIGSYVKTGMLDAQFDFNVYFTAIRAIAGQGSMADVNRVIEESLAAYGAHHTMGNISGNHDQVRFISLAGGAISFDEDGKEAGWTREVGVGDAAVAYKKALLLEALNLTIPGVPCIYQGDEYGEPGGGDPDNRKMMRFGGLNEQETAMRQAVSELIRLRRHSMPLLYGEYIPIEAGDSMLCFKRVYMGKQVVVAINTSAQPVAVNVDNETIGLAPYTFKIIE